MFSGLKVLELASVLAGPSVGQFFAELGAEVIKVENPKTHGDVTRSWKLPSEGDGDVSAYFSSVNWGKKSVSIDIVTEQGKHWVYKQVKETDIVITSYKPGDDIKLGMDYKTLSALNPKLIYGKITGYGDDDPRVGYDAIIQAESGFMYMNGEPSGEPTKMPVALVDVLAAHHLKEGVLVALLQRGKTGKGQCVSVSLYDAAVSSLANQATNYLVAGVVPQRMGSQHPNIAPYGDIFTTKCGRQLILAVGNNKQFKSLCRCLKLDAIPDNHRFCSNVERVKHRNELNDLLTNAISRYNLNELLHTLHGLKVPCGEIKDMKAVFDTKEAESLQIHSEKLHEKISGLHNFVAKLSDAEKNSHFFPPPHFGEHNNDFMA